MGVEYNLKNPGKKRLLIDNILFSPLILVFPLP
jgi:hypothetical protein